MNTRKDIFLMLTTTQCISIELISLQHIFDNKEKKENILEEEFL